MLCLLFRCSRLRRRVYALNQRPSVVRLRTSVTHDPGRTHLRWLRSYRARCEVHRMTADTRDEVGDDQRVRPPLHYDALKVLEAAQAG
jgi:hypothetical protein